MTIDTDIGAAITASIASGISPVSAPELIGKPRLVVKGCESKLLPHQQKAREIFQSWPKWKQEFRLTKYSPHSGK